MGKQSEKAWDEKITTEDALWTYNCRDCIYTLEAANELERVSVKMGLDKVQQQQQELLWPVLRTMINGVRIDLKVRAELTVEVREEVKKREQFIQDVLGHPLNPSSPKQMKALFYDDLK